MVRILGEIRERKIKMVLMKRMEEGVIQAQEMERRGEEREWVEIY